MTDKKLPDVVHFDKDPGLKKLTEVIGGYFQALVFPSEPPVFIIMREFNDPMKEKSTPVNIEISRMLNCEIRGRAAIIPYE